MTPLLEVRWESSRDADKDTSFCTLEFLAHSTLSNPVETAQHIHTLCPENANLEKNPSQQNKFHPGNRNPELGPLRASVVVSYIFVVSYPWPYGHLHLRKRLSVQLFSLPGAITAWLPGTRLLATAGQPPPHREAGVYALQLPMA